VKNSEHLQPDPRAWECLPTPPGIPDKRQLDLLAADAAERATVMLAGSPTDTEDPLIDAVRLLATTRGAPHTAHAAELTGISEEELRRLVRTHRHGGAAGVSAALEATACGPDEMSAAVGEVRSRRTFAVGDLAVDAGTITDAGAGIRLRLGPDRRWRPFTLAREQWWPAAGADPSAGIAYQAAARARALRRANG
jgi:hypothetical protein